MELSVEKSNYVTHEFINYLKLYLAVLFINSNISFSSFNKFFKDNLITITAESIVLLASVNILVFEYENHYILSINPNTYIAGTNLNLLTQCKFLNYGNLQIPGTHLFSDAFDYVAVNFENIYYQFMLGG